MSQELIERLRGLSPSIPAMRDAAAEIERLRSALAQSIQRVQELNGAATLRQQAARVDEVVCLWRLLDDIDTLDDAYKGDDAAFRKAAYEIQRKRFGIVSGDRFDALEAALSAQPAPVLFTTVREADEALSDIDSPFDNHTTAQPAPERQGEDKRAQGLYQKFRVKRTDGSDQPGGKHDGCDYFVLDVTHDPFAKPAAAAYATACEAEYPLLADDMRKRYRLTAAPVGVPDGATLPIDVRGKWHDVAIPVHLHVIALRDRLGQLEADETLVAVYDAVSRSNLTRDVKTPETKARIVREALAAAPSAPQGTQQGEG